MFGRKRPNRIAAILIAAILATQFNVTSFGAEAGDYGDSDASVSGPVVHFTVPPKSEEPEPEAPVYPTVTPIPNFTPVFPTFPTNLPAQTPVVIPTPVPTANPTPAANPGKNPTTVPTQNPSAGTTHNPAVQPTAAPTQTPSVNPSVTPTANPTTIPAEKQGAKTAPTPVPGVTLSSNNRSQEYLNKEEELKNMGMPETVRNYVLSKYIDKKNPESVRENLLKLMEGSPDIQSLEFREEEITIIQGEKTRLEPDIMPDNAKEELIWESDNENIVTVNEDGFAEGINPGETTITVRAKSGAYAKCSVKCLRSDSIAAKMKSIIENGSESVSENVSENNMPLDTVSDDSVGSGSVSGDDILPEGGEPITKIVLEGSLITIHPGDRIQIGKTLYPDGASESDLTWTSSKPSVASIDAKTGWIEGKTLGEATITVRATSGVSATCTIKVDEQLPEKVTLDVSSQIIVYVGEGAKQITATIEPPNVKQQYSKLIWEWADPGQQYASKSDTGGLICNVTGLKVGTTKLIVKAEANPINCRAECTVIVKRKASNLTISPKTVTIKQGEYFDNFTVTVTPNDADQTVSWRSTDSGIARIVNSSTGRVYGESPGTTTLTARSNSDSNISDTCTIKVEAVDVTGIDITNPSSKDLTVAVGEEKNITAKIFPENATNKKIKWVSSDPTVATVDPEETTAGATTATATVKVTGQKNQEQKIKITATTDDGGHKAECWVKVVPPNPVTEVTITPKPLQLKKNGPSRNISATVNEDATNKKLRWEIEDESIAVLSNITYTSCYVQGKKIGTTRIKAISLDNEEKVDYCDVVVTAQEITLTLNKHQIPADGQLPMYVDDTDSLRLSISPTGTQYKEITWDIDNSAVATLSGDGLRREVTGLSPGTATVTVTLIPDDEDDPQRPTDTCVITVSRRPVPVTGFEIDPMSMRITLGQSLPLSWTFDPPEADEEFKAVTISSNDPGIAPVSPVTAVGDGSTTVSGNSLGETDIIVSTADGKFSRTCHVTVDWIEPTSVTLSCDEIWMVEGETRKLEATVLPGNADDKSVSWNSADRSIATVDQDGTVHAVSEGTTIVTVVTNDGGHKAVCAVHVRKKGADAESITVDPPVITRNVGQYFDLTATILPENADKYVTWKTNDQTLVVVSGNGLSANAVGKAKGTAVITATTSNGKTAVCLVTVDEPSKVYVEDVYLDQMRKTIYVGESFDLTANVVPDNAYDKTVTWSSGDVKIATVSEGRVTGLKKGEVTITVTANGDTLDGEPATAVCYVTVKDEPQPAPDVYKLFIVDERSGAYRPDKVRGTVESLAGDRYLVIRDSSGSEIKPLINGDSSLSYTRALFYDMWIVDINGWPKEDFVKCTARIPLPKDMDINKGTVRVVTMLNGRLDKSISSSVGEEDGVQYVSFTTTHFTQYAILYKEVSKQSSTTVVYRDVPVIQYRETTSQPVYYTQPAPAQTIPFVNTRVLDNVPRTGDINYLRENLCEIFTSRPKREK